jgi:protein O-GlcNAc transferase
MRKRIGAAFDEFHDVRRNSDKEVAKLLNDRQVDIAVDLAGYTQDGRPSDTSPIILRRLLICLIAIR